MPRRPHPLAVILVVGSCVVAACQLIDGIGDDLAFDPGDAASQQDGAPHDGESPGSDASDARVTPGSDGGSNADADATDGAAVLDGAADADDGGYDPYRGCLQDAGTTMVRIDVPDASFCIDVTEVTRQQFAQYMATHSSVADAAPPACKTDAAAVERPMPPVGQPADNPATGMNFCFAWDYCNSIGKRLCGNLGGGPVTSRASSEWHYACSNGLAATAYPYGNDFDAGACVTDAAGPSPVRSHPGCRGVGAPFNLIFDMSGNVEEFDMTASTFDGSESLPTVAPRGGSFLAGSSGVSCSDEDPFGMYTEGTWAPPLAGLRCCADAR